MVLFLLKEKDLQHDKPGLYLFISDTDNFCNTYKIEIQSDLVHDKTSYDSFCKVQNRKMYVTDLT